MTTALPTVGPLPGPPKPALLGWRAQSLKFLRDPIAFMRMLYRDYGRLAAWMDGNPWWVFGFGPEYNHRVLSDPVLFYTVPGAPSTTPVDSSLARLTRTLLNMNGDQHRQQRRLVLPAFHRKRVESYRDRMVALTASALDGWRAGQKLDIARAMQELTLCIAAETLFGLDATAEANATGTLIHGWIALLESPGALLLPRDWPGTPFRRLLVDSARLEGHIKALIERKRANLAAHDDVLAMLIQARDDDGVALTDAELIGQTAVIFIAGHETSSNALTWTLFLLAQHPRVLRDVCDELEGALHGDAPTVAELGQLPLLERVIKESMRLLPPAPFLVRAATAPLHLGPYALPAGATVTLSPYITHHMPDLYPAPERFQPERWEQIAPSLYEYMPFGAGPHMCIGATFAMMEISIVLAMILQRYRLELRPGARIDRHVRLTLSPKQGMPMIIRPRDQAVRPQAVRGNIREMVELGE